MQAGGTAQDAVKGLQNHALEVADEKTCWREHEFRWMQRQVSHRIFSLRYFCCAAAKPKSNSL